MAYQTILSEKQSTYGSPYCYYTVSVEPTERTATSVKLTVKVVSHLAASDSYLYNGYALTGTLKVTSKGTAISIPIKASSEYWSGTTTHTATASATISGVAASTTALLAKFSVSNSGADSCSLNEVSCSNITIPKGTGTTGFIYIDNGTSFDKYSVYIDNGTSWSRYIPYRDNGTSWVVY